MGINTRVLMHIFTSSCLCCCLQVRGLKQEREGTEGLVKEMGTKSEQLQQWLERNEPKAEALQASGGIDWDTGENWI